MNASGSGANGEAPSSSKRRSADSGEEPKRRCHQPTAEAVSHALRRAILHEDVERIRVLLDGRHDVLLATDEYGRTPLHCALLWGKEAVAEILADVCQHDIQDMWGHTPLHMAALRGFTRTIEKLLVSGANARLKDGFGWTPLHSAVLRQQEAAVEILTGVDGQIDIRDENGNTPLHNAARYGFVQVARKLLFEGVYPYSKNYRGFTSLFSSLMGCHDAITNLILASCTLRDVNIDWKAMNKIDMELCIPFHSECKAEIERMRETRIPESRVTFYDIARRQTCCVTPRLRPESIRHVEQDDRILTEFPKYGALIAWKLRQVRERRALEDHFFECFSGKLPPSCIEIILLCLTKFYLRKFLYAVEPQPGRFR